MNLKELLIQELDNAPDLLIMEVLDFLHFLKAKQDHEDLQDARAALSIADTEGTMSWTDLKAEVGL